MRLRVGNLRRRRVPLPRRAGDQCKDADRLRRKENQPRNQLPFVPRRSRGASEGRRWGYGAFDRYFLSKKTLSRIHASIDPCGGIQACSRVCVPEIESIEQPRGWKTKRVCFRVLKLSSNLMSFPFKPPSAISTDELREGSSSGFFVSTSLSRIKRNLSLISSPAIRPARVEVRSRLISRQKILPAP